MFSTCRKLVLLLLADPEAVAFFYVFDVSKTCFTIGRRPKGGRVIYEGIENTINIINCQFI